MKTRLLPLLWILMASSARAEDPCAADLKAFCPEVKPGSGRVAACLREHRDEISAACVERLDADARNARRVIEEFGRACRRDVDRFCAAIEPGRGRILACLNQHQVEVSAACQAELNRVADARERIATLRKACVSDIERLCQDVPPQARPLLDCLQASAASLSAGCNTAELRRAADAASVIDVIEQMTTQEKIKEGLEILQGVDSVAFSRSQVLLQLDSYDGLAGRASAFRVLFNPQLVFGPKYQYSLQLKAPVTTLFPSSGAATQSGLGDVITAFAWNFFALWQMRHFVSLGLQWDTASQAALGGIWALQPAYAVAFSLARWVSFTTQVAWTRSLGSTGSNPEVNLLVLEPILVANLPGRSFVTLDTKLGWTLADGTFVPVMKAVAGIFTDRERSVSITAWYQASLTSAAVAKSFEDGVGLGLAYFYDF